MQREPLRTKKIICLSMMLAGFVVGQAADASAHALWNMPAPRDNRDGYKPPPRNPGFVLPCGVARNANQPTTNLRAGAMQMVQWTETTTHPGCFLIEFSRSDTEPFQQLTVYPHPNATNTPLPYSTMVRLPDQPCTGCILRLRQVMLGNNTATCPPANLSDLSPDLYYSCANINLTADSGNADGGRPPDGGGARDAGRSPDTRPPGSGGSGGSEGTGGSAGGYGTGGASGASGSAGGAPAAGSGGGAAGRGGSAGAAAPAPQPADDAGGCSIGGRNQNAAFALGFVGLMGAFIWRARRRRGR